MMDTERFDVNILTLVYGQYWPANIPTEYKLNRITPCSRPPVVKLDAWTKTDSGPRPPSKDRGGIYVPEKYSQDMDSCKLTKSQFRKLADQVREVHIGYPGRIRTSTSFRNLRSAPTKNDNQPILYRSQLAESMKVFQKKTWNPHDSTTETRRFRREPLHVRCKPIMGSNPWQTETKTLNTSKYVYEPRQRPSSSPAKMRDNQTGEFDSLSTSNIYSIAACDIIDSGFGDITDNGDKAISESDMSDDENIPEPSVDESRCAPDLYLRPENMQAVYSAEHPRDYLKYDFDASRVLLPSYEFEYAGPIEFKHVDFNDLSKFDKDWREMTKRRPANVADEAMIDRFIQLERLQTKTIEWEISKKEKARAAIRHKMALSQILKSQGRRAQSARSRDRKCCGNCLQPACTGDCPTKKAAQHICIQCRQPYCNGRCAQSSTAYTDHTRQTPIGSDDDDVRSKPPTRPQSCNACQNRTSRGKLINANNIIMGRPRSSHATYSSGGRCAKIGKDLRPRSGIQVDDDLSKQFDKLGVDQHSRPSTAKRTKIKGRSAVIPGKAFHSQRHNSLTTTRKIRIKSAPPRLKRARAVTKRSQSAKTETLNETMQYN
ncbi:uncharacterized protein LOC141900980 [Tubulanus polymorphus]|uniref:uncharacterized protein LOC141900980 n=1 Tax=Tubulanus polymorphus TaxID=672921 RepID=UPI003DA36F87